MESVLIHWSVDVRRVDEFLAYRKPVDADAPGFLRETLYRIDTVDGAPDGAVNFVNVGMWNSRAEFYTYLKIEPGTVPDMLDFEVARRRREWVVPLVETIASA